MPRGTYDYGLPVAQQTEYTSDDLYELAARQGVYCQNNRSGNVIFNIGDAILTNYLLYSSSGSGANQLPSTKYSYYGKPMMQINTGTLASDYTNTALNTPPFSGLQVGIEALMMMWSMYGWVSLGMQIFRPTFYAYSRISVKISTGQVNVWNGAGAWESAGTIPVYGGTGSLFSMKFSFDLSTFKYGYLWYGSEQSLSLQTHSMQHSGMAGGDTNILEWVYTNDTLGSLTIYLGDIITTVNELV